MMRHRIGHGNHELNYNRTDKMKTVTVIDTTGLDETTISQIEATMIYTNDYYENDTLFVELHNSKGEIIRIFPERIQEI